MSDKYNAEQLRDLAAHGHAMKNDDGSISYPIADGEDLGRAIKGVGRGSADHDAIRRHVMKRAGDLGMSDQIPASWSSDGSLQTNAATGDNACSLCDGSGELDDGDECPACKGSGEERKAARSRGSLAERRSALHTGYARRTFTFDIGAAGPTLGLQVRSGGPGAPVDAENIGRLFGYALRYGGTTYDVNDRFGTFSEEMRSGACAESLAANDDVVFLYDHVGMVMGRRSAGTLRLAENVQGLAIETDLDLRQSVAKDLNFAIERGDVHQMSVGFQVPAGGDEWNAAGTVRKINRLQLIDVSAVGIPASPTTTIGLADADARSLDSAHLVVRSVLGKLRPMTEGIELPAEARAAWAQVESRMLNAKESDDLAGALEALHLADDFALPIATMALILVNEALDDAQGAISETLGLPDPDGGPEDEQPALVDDSRQRDLDLLDLRRRRMALRR